jgi:translation elongation factor aEF-1 beta
MNLIPSELNFSPLAVFVDWFKILGGFSSHVYKCGFAQPLERWKELANVVISFKIFPSEATVDLNLLRERIAKGLPKFASVRGFAEEPIAFGLNALIAHFTLPEDRSGVLDEVENYLLKIGEISQVETLMVRRV